MGRGRGQLLVGVVVDAPRESLLVEVVHEILKMIADSR